MHTPTIHDAAIAIRAARTARAGALLLLTGGTTETRALAAERLARDAGAPLHRVDLKAVVSKYIGETEKQLGRLLADAVHGNWILFFDEADALFGKRSDVHDSHDRYANIEVSYLLQRLEQFEGIALLATNRRTDIDDAFLRRLRVQVELPPGTPRA